MIRGAHDDAEGSFTQEVGGLGFTDERAPLYQGAGGLPLSQTACPHRFHTGQRVMVSATCEAGVVSEAHHFMAKDSQYAVKIDGHPHKYAYVDEDQIEQIQGVTPAT